MDFFVQASPSGGYNVMLRGSEAPISCHDTHREAERRAAAYARGARDQPHRSAQAGSSSDPANGRLVRLRGGSTVQIRPVTPRDKPLFTEAFKHFGERSRYQRFMGLKLVLSPAELSYLTEVDHHDHEALGALDPSTGSGVGVARFVRLPTDPTKAEAAVAVVDEWQGLGVGSALLEHLVERAREEGITSFTATLLVDNMAMLQSFRNIGSVHVKRRAGTQLEIDVELPTQSVADACTDGHPARHALRTAAALSDGPARDEARER